MRRDARWWALEHRPARRQLCENQHELLWMLAQNVHRRDQAPRVDARVGDRPPAMQNVFSGHRVVFSSAQIRAAPPAANLGSLRSTQLLVLKRSARWAQR